jgi:hypothetical protein
LDQLIFIVQRELSKIQTNPINFFIFSVVSIKNQVCWPKTDSFNQFTAGFSSVNGTKKFKFALGKPASFTGFSSVNQH